MSPLVPTRWHKIFLFLVTNGNLTLFFHKGVNSIRADESSPLAPMKCLNKQNKILLFLGYFFVKKIPLSRRVSYVMDGSMDE